MERPAYLCNPPNFVELEIVETDPCLKGDTAGTGGKPATGSLAQSWKVLFVQIGEVIKGYSRNTFSAEVIHADEPWRSSSAASASVIPALFHYSPRVLSEKSLKSKHAG